MLWVQVGYFARKSWYSCHAKWYFWQFFIVVVIVVHATSQPWPRSRRRQPLPRAGVAKEDEKKLWENKIRCPDLPRSLSFRRRPVSKLLSDAIVRRPTALQHPKIVMFWGVSRPTALQTTKSSVMFRTFASSTAHRASTCLWIILVSWPGHDVITKTFWVPWPGFDGRCRILVNSYINIHYDVDIERVNIIRFGR